MKIYVTGFDLKQEYKEDVKAGRPHPQVDSHDIFYNIKPLWTFPYKELAEGELRILQPMRVHVGNHYCELEVEQIGEEKFSIVCNNHPEHTPKP